MISNSYPWLQPYRESIAATIKQGRLPHALLLTGQPGMGKAEFADFLARLLLCEQPLQGSSPCGRCPACTLLNAGSHPDYQYVSFEINEKTGKLREEIVVDQMRTLAARPVPEKPCRGLQGRRHHAGQRLESQRRQQPAKDIGGTVR